MFAVKGWAVDSGSLKLQTEISYTSVGVDRAKEATPGNERKRKRHGRDPIQSEDVGELWERHIEGKTRKPAIDRSKNKRKRQKNEVSQAQIENTHNSRNQDRPDAINTSRKEVGKTTVRKKNNTETAVHRDHDGAPRQSDSTAKSKTLSNTTPTPSMPNATKLTPMQAAMRQKLVSARFRHLNETLYTAPSDKALEMFGQNPEMFEDYHAGFRQQVSVWPENPVDKFIAAIRERGKIRLPSQKKAFRDKKGRGKSGETEVINDGHIAPLPRTQGACIISDLGCGDARLAQTLRDSGDVRKLNLKIASYDLHSPSSLVTKADISNIPAADGSVDVAIFCLALMGTNWISFIEEAYRILHWKGELWVAEIKSRYGRVSRAGKPVEHSVGNKRKMAAAKKLKETRQREQEEINEQETLEAHVDGVETKAEETDVSHFVDVLRRRGFILKNGDSSIDLSNKMFVKMEFAKAVTPTKGKGVPPAGAKEHQKPKSKAKFLEEAPEDPATEDESAVLKPSLYKIR